MTTPRTPPVGPFCSERCKKIDLGAWLSADYRISRPMDLEDLERSPMAPYHGSDRDES
jgi:endogenous inhibitor of DNA gyrase (YacG/DUF329 family)